MSLCYKDRTYCITKCPMECLKKLDKETEQGAKEFGLSLSLQDFNCEGRDKDKTE